MLVIVLIILTGNTDKKEINVTTVLFFCFSQVLLEVKYFLIILHTLVNIHKCGQIIYRQNISID